MHLTREAIMAPIHPLDDKLREQLRQREKGNSLRVMSAPRAGYVDFCSNDYLGLARSAPLHKRIHEHLLAHNLQQNGSTGSRLLSGHCEAAEDAETFLARLFSAEATLIFNSGYAANTAVLSSLPGPHDTIIYDELAHASIKDGARLSLAKRFTFRHNDLNDLERKIKKGEGQVFVVVESVYSMDGDSSPLNTLVELTEKHNAILVVDEAHTTGLCGPGGSGYCIAQHLHDRIPVRIYTFGKAMGVHGACVAGSRVLIDYLMNTARPFIYTTAPPPAFYATIRCAFEFLAEHLSLQEELADRIAWFSQAARSIVPHWKPAAYAIHAVLVPGNERVRQVAGALQNACCDVRPILSPTVPAGSERLRICLHTFNTRQEIDQLADHLARLIITT